MARGLMEMKQAAEAKHVSLYDIEPRIQYFLDRFYLMRISIRLLIHQHCESCCGYFSVIIIIIRIIVTTSSQADVEELITKCKFSHQQQ